MLAVGRVAAEATITAASPGRAVATAGNALAAHAQAAAADIGGTGGGAVVGGC